MTVFFRKPVFFGILIPFLFLFSEVLSRPTAAENALIVGFFHRPPYYIKGDQPTGILVERTRVILKDSGIAYKLEEMSVNRITIDLKKTERPFCSIGWFKTADRESYALFTDPIYRNQPLHVVFRSTEKERFDALTTFKSLIAGKEFCPGLAKNFSYGDEIDKQVRKKQEVCRLGDAEHNNLLKMLVAKRFDYVLTAPEELEDLVEKSGIKSTDVSFQGLTDMPFGEFRYIMCNKAVDAKTITALNRAIAAHPQPSK